MKWGGLGLQDLVNKANQAKAAAQQAASMVSDAVASENLAATLQQRVQGALKQLSEAEKIDADYVARQPRDELESLFITYAEKTKAAENERKELEQAIANFVPNDTIIEEDPLVELRLAVTELNEQLQIEIAKLRKHEDREAEDARRREAVIAQKEQAEAELEKNKEAIVKIENKRALIGSRTDEAFQRIQEKSSARQAEQRAAIEQLESLPRAKPEDLSQAEQAINALRMQYQAAKAAAAKTEAAEKDAKLRAAWLKQSLEDLERSKARVQELEQKSKDDVVKRREELEAVRGELESKRENITSLQADLDALPRPEPYDEELQTCKDRIREQCGKNARLLEHVKSVDDKRADLNTELTELSNSLHPKEDGVARMASEEFLEKLEAAQVAASLAAANAEEAKAACDEQIAAQLSNVKAAAKLRQEQLQEVNEALKAARTLAEEKEERLRQTQEEVTKIRSTMPSAQKVQNAQARVEDLEEAIRRVRTKMEQAEQEHRSLEKDREPPSLEATERRGVVLSVTVNDTVWLLLGADGKKPRWWKREQLLLDDDAIGDPLEVSLRHKNVLLEQAIAKCKAELQDEQLRLERIDSAFSAFRQTISHKLATSVAPELGQREKDNKRLAGEIEMMERELLQEKRKQHDILEAEKELEADVARVIAEREQKQVEVDALRQSVADLKDALAVNSKFLQDSVEDEEVALDPEDEATLANVSEQLRKAREEVSALEIQISEEKRRVQRIRHVPIRQDDGLEPSRSSSALVIDAPTRSALIGPMNTTLSHEHLPEIHTKLSASPTIMSLNSKGDASGRNRSSVHFELPAQAYTLNIEAVHEDIEKLNARKAYVEAQRESICRAIQEKSSHLDEVKQLLRSQNVVDRGNETEYIRNVFRSAMETRPITNENLAMVHVLWQFFDFAPEELILLDKRRVAKETKSWW